MAVTYSLRAQYVGNYGGGTVAFGSYAQTFNIGAALTAGGGSFVVTDAELAAVLDRYPALFRSADDGQALVPAIQPRWSATSVGAGLAADQVAFEVRRSAETYARWQVLGDGSQTAGDGVSPPAAMPSLASMSTSITSLGVSVAAVQTGMIRSTDAASPINTAKLYISNSGWDPVADPIAGLTTPTRGQVVIGGKYDIDGGGGIDYLWNLMGYQVNTGTAPLTPVMGRARGWTVYPLSSSGRVYGATPQIHGLEITAGDFVSEATATRNGTDTLTAILPTEEGSRFEAGMPISGTGIPGGTTILGVTGRPGAPTTIQMSAAASAGTGAIVAQPTSPEVIGTLYTGNRGSGNTTVNASIGIQFQAQNVDSHWAKGIQFGASALTTTGRGIVFSSVSADRGISFESVTLANGVIFSSGNYSGGVISYSSVTAASAINIASSNTFSTAAIVLSGQDIATDTTTGMKIATVSTQKIGFYGKTPIVRPTATAAATDAATTQTLANGIRTALINLGLWA